MELDKWIGVSPQVLAPDTMAQKLFENLKTPSRFIVNSENGEVLIALDPETIRISVQRRSNKKYCIFQLPIERVSGLGKYTIGNMQGGIYEDPDVSNITREQAMEILGIAE